MRTKYTHPNWPDVVYSLDWPDHIDGVILERYDLDPDVPLLAVHRTLGCASFPHGIAAEESEVEVVEIDLADELIDDPDVWFCDGCWRGFFGFGEPTSGGGDLPDDEGGQYRRPLAEPRAILNHGSRLEGGLVAWTDGDEVVLTSDADDG